MLYLNKIQQLSPLAKLESLFKLEDTTAFKHAFQMTYCSTSRVVLTDTELKFSRGKWRCLNLRDKDTVDEAKEYGPGVVIMSTVRVDKTALDKFM